MKINYLLIVISSIFLTSVSIASLDLKRGDPAPNLVLKAVDGDEIDTAKMMGSTILLLFAEAGQPQSERSIQLISKSLESSQLSDQDIKWILILSKHSDPEKLLSDFTRDKRKPIIIHDMQRKAFGAYRTVVLPSAVIIDKQGKFVHGLAGYTPDFGDTILDALLVSSGKMTPESFDKNLKGVVEKEIDENQLRAERFAHFALRLSQRSLISLAEAKYREALELVPDLQMARLGLAEILLSQNKMSEAQGLFRGVLAENPDSEAALLGLARISLKLEPPDLVYAQSLVERVLKHNISSARGHYELGVIYELQGDSVKAAASYKLAAEILLKRIS